MDLDEKYHIVVCFLNTVTPKKEHFDVLDNFKRQVELIKIILQLY